MFLLILDRRINQGKEKTAHEVIGSSNIHVPCIVQTLFSNSKQLYKPVAIRFVELLPWLLRVKSIGRL